MSRRRIAAAALAAAAALTGLAVAAPPAHAAADCAGPGRVQNGEGQGFAYDGRILESGPYATCRDVLRTDDVTDFYLHCYWVNDYGNYWYYVRLAGTQTHGWFYDGDVVLRPTDENGNGRTDVRYCAGDYSIPERPIPRPPVIDRPLPPLPTPTPDRTVF